MDKCLYYKSEKNCSKCEDNYYLTEEGCEATNIRNCILFENIDQCKVCDREYILEGKNCVKINIPESCSTTTNFHPIECTSCKVGYYLDKGNCKIVDRLI